MKNMTSELKKIANQNETANAVVKVLTNRQRNRSYTPLSGLRSQIRKAMGKDVNRQQFDQVFMELDNMGLGVVKKSKRGLLSGFAWLIPVKELGQKVEAVQVSKKRQSLATVIIVHKNGKTDTVRIPEDKLKELVA